MYLFKVEDTFMIKSGGVVLAPGFPSSEKVIKGARLKLVRPDGSELYSSIAGFEFKVKEQLILLSNLKKADVPVGTEVFLDEDLL